MAFATLFTAEPWQLSHIKISCKKSCMSHKKPFPLCRGVVDLPPFYSSMQYYSEPIQNETITPPELQSISGITNTPLSLSIGSASGVVSALLLLQESLHLYMALSFVIWFSSAAGNNISHFILKSSEGLCFSFTISCNCLFTLTYSDNLRGLYLYHFLSLHLCLILLLF